MPILLEFRARPLYQQNTPKPLSEVVPVGMFPLRLTVLNEIIIRVNPEPAATAENLGSIHRIPFTFSILGLGALGLNPKP